MREREKIVKVVLVTCGFRSTLLMVCNWLKTFYIKTWTNFGGQPKIVSITSLFFEDGVSISI